MPRWGSSMSTPPRGSLVNAQPQENSMGRAQVNAHHRVRFVCGQAKEGTLPAELRPEGYHCNDPRLPMSHHRDVSTRHRHQARRTNGGRSRSSVRITGGEVDEPNLFLNYLLSVFPVSRVTLFVVASAWAHLINGLLDLGFFRPISGHDTATPDKGAQQQRSPMHRPLPDQKLPGGSGFPVATAQGEASSSSFSLVQRRMPPPLLSLGLVCSLSLPSLSHVPLDPAIHPLST
jgi:hypothetical protein